VDVSHSDAWRNNQWSAIELDTVDSFSPVAGGGPTGLNFDISDGHAPFGQILGPDPARPAIQGVSIQGGVGDYHRRNAEVDPQHTGDMIEAVTGSMVRHFDDSFFTNFEFGARFSDRVKKHWQYSFRPTPPSTSFATETEEFTVKGFTAPPVVW